MYDEPKDIGMIGENAFAFWASQAGFAPTKIVWDKYGTDFIIQARPTAASRRRLLVDPPVMSCVVQVKTTRKRDGHVDIALSNLHALATNPMPAFLIVVVLDDDEQPCDVRVIHLDRGWVERITKRIVEVPLEDRDGIHKKTFRCHWSADGTPLEKPHYWMSLIGFIERTAGVDAREYAAEKKRWNDEVGYDARPFRVRFTLPKMAADEANDALARFAVGLLDKIPLSSMTIAAVRFGESEVVHDLSGAESIHFQFNGDPPHEEVELTVRTSDGQEEAVLAAKLRTARSIFSFLPDEHDIWRFTSDYLDIIVRSPKSDENPGVTFSLSIAEGGPLPDIARAVRAFRILSAGNGGDFLVRLSADTEPYLLGFPPQASTPIVRGSRYRQAIEDADRIVRLFGVENIVITDGEALDREWKRLRLMVLFQGPLDGGLEMRTRLMNDPTGEPWNPNDVEQLAIVDFNSVRIEGRTLCQTYAVKGRPTFETRGTDTWIAMESRVVELLGRRIFRSDDPHDEMLAFARAEAERLRKRMGLLVIGPGREEAATS